jgi:hypothetical protein
LVTNGVCPLATVTTNTEPANESGAEACACAMKGTGSHAATKKETKSRVFIACFFDLLNMGSIARRWHKTWQGEHPIDALAKPIPQLPLPSS